jgi:peptidoglycan/xylan/chitin deacetylase (PgdA/CDA1 family)
MTATNPTRLDRPPWRLPGVPVFVYHGLADKIEGAIPGKEWKYWVSSAQFREYVDYISRNRCRVSLLKDLLHGNDVETRGRPDVVLTFDDGRASDYRLAFPYLLHHGFRAEFFVNTAKVGSPEFLSWPQIVEMKRAGMSIQSHGHDHIDLTRLPRGELGRQLRISKQILEERLGGSVDILAAPHGRLSRRVIEEALEQGYRAVCSARSLPALPGAQKLNRVVLYRDTPFGEFQQLLEGNPARYLARIARAPFHWPKRALQWFQPLPLNKHLPEERT